MKCGIPQGSILGPLIFLLYINDLQFASELLEPIVFADDTNLLYSNKDTNTVFLKVNGLFLTSSHLMWKKPKHSFFHKSTKKDDIPLVLAKLIINNPEIARTESIKFIGVLLDENLSWKTYIKYIENKISKNTGISFKARLFFNKEVIIITLILVYSYINYGSISWWSTCRTSLKRINSQQKHALRIIFNKSKFELTSELFKSSKILNIYKLNIFNNGVFRRKIQGKSTPSIFCRNSEKPFICIQRDSYI